MTQCTTSNQRSFLEMTNRTFEIRYQELLKEINNHPHKDELIELMAEQVAEDTYHIPHK